MILNPSMASRFWSKVDSTYPKDCWLWMAARYRFGYGYLGLGSRKDGSRRKVSAHRIAYELAIGPIPNGLCVLHHCDNPPCCNPAHLFLGTKKDNACDRNRKERQARGEHHGCAKLTKNDVRTIRFDSRSMRTIAADYNVSHVTINRIKTRQSWAHIL